MQHHAASRYFSPERPRVFAHRGLAGERPGSIPENTFAAFEAAWQVGARYLETDVHATSDGVAVLVHDPELTVDGVRYRIESTSFDVLSALDLGSGQHVPTLAEALERFPDAYFNIDVKVPAAVAPATHSIADALATERVLVTSFDERTRLAAVSRLPGVVSSASSRSMTRALPWLAAGSPKGVRRALGGVQAVQIPQRHSGIRLVTPRSISTFHRAGVEVHVWTVNEPADMERLLGWGVDGIITDRCDVAIEVVQHRN